MSEPHPSAVSIWAEANDAFGVCLDGHTFTVPVSEAGTKTLFRILQARRTATFSRYRIGHDESPIQYVVEQWVKETGKKFPSTLEFDDLEIKL